MKIKIIKGIETPVTKFFCSSSTPETDAARHDLSDCGSPVPCSWGDWVAADFACKVERERDEAREIATEADAGHDMAILHLEKCKAAANLMAERAKELIVRWDQPSWKDTAPTARFINALRIAVRAYERES